jgi:hypothetical protein
MRINTCIYQGFNRSCSEDVAKKEVKFMASILPATRSERLDWKNPSTEKIVIARKRVNKNRLNIFLFSSFGSEKQVN